MTCYLCGNGMDRNPSWRDLFFLDRAETICKGCRGSFVSITEGCRICGVSGTAWCEECRHWETTEFQGVIDWGKTLYSYNSAMKEYMHQYKFLQDAVLAEVFADELAGAVRKTGAAPVPIPMNPVNLVHRTFAQVDRMLEAGGVEFVHLLRKNEEIQGEKTREERMTTRGLFTLNGIAVPKRIVLVDDMYTTGTTLRLAASLLKEAGAEDIGFIALIRA